MMNRNAESKADTQMASFRKGDKRFLNKISSDATNDLKGYRSEDIDEKLNRGYSEESFKVLLRDFYKHIDDDDINLLDESDENQHVDIDSRSQRSAFRGHNSMHSENDSPRSRAPSMDSGDDEFFNESVVTDNQKDEQDVSTVTTQVPRSFGVGGGGGAGMNYIMLVIILAGLLLTKTLEYMQLCFVWLQKQIMQLRNVLLGGSTIWEFMDMDDNSRFHRHTKCLLLPFIVICFILYGFITILCIIVDLLLNATPPKGLSNFIQKLCN